ncbi:MAG: hypothetical protein SNF33_00395 [Candidatus Algichlamydia australiensis]|nr:hypothetical protein [Chlamydiales bacterium]
MRYEIDRDQRHFFEENGYIEFEEVAEKSLPQIVAELFKEPCLRLAFEWKIGTKNAFPVLEQSLRNFVSISPIICAIIYTEERVLVLAPNHRYPFHEIKNAKIIGYTTRKAVVKYHPNDPFTGELKNLGYASGDRLKSETHPILYNE